MIPAAATVASKWETAASQSTYALAVISPRVGRLVKRSSSVAQALRNLFEITEELGTRFPFEVGRDQGRLVVLLPKASDAFVIHEVIAKKHYFSEYLRPRLAVTEFSWIERNCAPKFGSTLVELAYYLSLQSARLSSSEEPSSSSSMPSVFDALHNDDPASIAFIVRSLYAVPLSRRWRAIDELARWAMVDPKIAAQSYFVRSDLHGTEHGFVARSHSVPSEHGSENATPLRGGLSQDLRPNAYAFLHGKLNFWELIQRSLQMRYGHDDLFDRYFDPLVSAEPSLYRAAGDGVIGYTDSPERIIGLFAAASARTGGRLASGVTVVPRTGDPKRDEELADHGIETTKLLKDEPDPFQLVLSAPNRIKVTSGHLVTQP